MREDFRLLLNTNSRENSERTIETTRILEDEIASQVTIKPDDIWTSLNLQVQEAYNTATTESVLPFIENSLVAHGRANLTMEHKRASGLQDSLRATNFSMADQWAAKDFGSYKPSENQKTKENCIKLGFSHVNQREMSRECSVGSYTSEQNRAMVTGANPTPHLVPEFLTGRHMQSCEPLQRQKSVNDESQDIAPPVPEATTQTTPPDPIHRLAEVLVGMLNRPSAQTLIIRPVSTTTLTFDGKSEKFELFEDLFHTMIKIQPDMTEALKLKPFSLIATEKCSINFP